ncbi:MAG: hypothetical protein WC796_05490 [Candidatus Pacearchaeota archaeon]|jgi:hypothetical protein
MYLIKKEDKKGQYFLIAAIIIVVVILGLAVGINNTLVTKKDSSKTYDLSKELKLESESVVNYGIFNQQNLQNVLDSFVENYSHYIGEDNDVYFVYGNGQNINYTAYSVSDVGSISLDLGTGAPVKVDIKNGVLKKGGQQTTSNSVNISIDDISYPFELSEGENFFFVIQEPRNNETG